ncbi:MAG TPA: sigma-70 family RNA polymerase sigma factor [Gemmataceae bacterium]|nr:sigma-70 family RNA polymerase sigma factor [Gemmataceae bacterium]
MPEHPVNTLQLHNWLDRMRAGDPAAREDLLRHLCGRLERLASKMIRRFPRVQHWVQTDDVLQNALMRLLRALEQVRPGSMRDFFGLAAAQMRRELLDLARHFFGPHGPGAHHAGQLIDSTLAAVGDPVDRAEDLDDLERWYLFHQQVEQLPIEEREVVGLVFYHGWTQAQVAELFQVSIRTVRRRWEAAMVKLYGTLREGGTGTPETSG